MKVLVTGANGFLGNHLTAKLVKEGYEVKFLSQQSSGIVKINISNTNRKLLKTQKELL